jgi:hypothetical protein
MDNDELPGPGPWTVIPVGDGAGPGGPEPTDPEANVAAGRFMLQEDDRTPIPDPGPTIPVEVSIWENGTFIYYPPLGFVGEQEFTYTATDGVRSVTGTVTITVSTPVLYVKAGAPGGGNGRSHQPLNAFPAPQDVGANAIIYVYYSEETHDNDGILEGGFILHDGMKLWGEGINLTIGGDTLWAGSGNRPHIAGAEFGLMVLGGDGSTGAMEIRGLDISGQNGIFSQSSSGATEIVIAGNTIAASTGYGIGLSQAGGGEFIADIHDNAITGGDRGINLEGVNSAVITIANLAGNTVSGYDSRGISISGAVFDAAPGGDIEPVQGGTTSVSDGGPGVVITGASGALHFADLSISVSGTALEIEPDELSSAVLSFAADAVTISARGGPAIVASRVNLDLPSGSVTSEGSFDAGMSLTDVGGSLSLGGGLTDAVGNAFKISGGDIDISYSGTLSSSGATPVDIHDMTGGSVAFTGAIVNPEVFTPGSSPSISLADNTGATITFAGGIDLATSDSEVFVATGGGTVEVCADTLCGGGDPVVNSLQGGPLRVEDTAIGSAGLTFQSLELDGGSSAAPIVLRNTGTAGGLTITGDGTESLGGNESGGRLSSIVPVTLSSTGNVVLQNVVLFGGINAQNVDQVTLRSSGIQPLLTAITYDNTVDSRTAALTLDKVATLNLSPEPFELASVSKIDGEFALTVIDSELAGGGFDVSTLMARHAGLTTSVTIQGSTISDTESVLSFDGESMSTFQIDHNTFTNISGTALELQVDNGLTNLTVSDNEFSGLTGGALTAWIRDESGYGQVTVANNSVTNGASGFLISGPATGSSSYSFTGNSLGTENALAGPGIELLIQENEVLLDTRSIITVANNAIAADPAGAAIAVTAATGSPGLGPNVLNLSGNTAASGIVRIESSNFAATCLDINADNVAANRNNAADGYVITTSSNGTLLIDGMPAGSQTDIAVAAFWDVRNDGGAFAVDGGSAFGGTC